ncbi:MAG: hypothetical protein ACOVOE_10495, partial [Caulobacter sp.]
ADLKKEIAKGEARARSAGGKLPVPARAEGQSEALAES